MLLVMKAPVGKKLPQKYMKQKGLDGWDGVNRFSFFRISCKEDFREYWLKCELSSAAVS